MLISGEDAAALIKAQNLLNRFCIYEKCIGCPLRHVNEAVEHYCPSQQLNMIISGNLVVKDNLNKEK